MKRLTAFALVAGLASCSETAPTRIDGSSPEAFERTIAIVRQDLPAADRLAFDAAIATVPGRRYANRDPAATARASFDGMTAAEVVETERRRTTGERQ